MLTKISLHGQCDGIFFLMPADDKPRVVRWTAPQPPTEEEAEARMRQEGYESFRWYDVPGMFYPKHRHSYDECLWVIRGEITFTIDGTDYPLSPGDRLYLPASMPHTAKVPTSASVTYLVGRKQS